MNKQLILLGTILTSLVPINAQTTTERAEIVKNYNLPILNEMARSAARKAELEKSEAIEFAKKNNIPVIFYDRDGSKSELIRIENGVPIYYTNSNVAAARSTRANFLNPGGALGLNLTGENITVGIWDGGGVRTTHQEMTGRVTIGDNATSTGDAHATHVGGTIAARGAQANAKGMAPSARIKSFEWNSDAAEMINEASNGLLISNHSYGYRPDLLPDYYFGGYIDVSAQWDNILFNTPYYVICKAAGNDGTSTANGSPLGGSSSAFDKLSGGATSKNVIVVANANDAVIDSNGNLTSVSINSSSSQGPTDDLRIKPDIAGNGTGVYSSVSSSDTAYSSLTGTSMASPNVAGTLTLVNNHFRNVTGQYMLGAALRGLALHTADDAGTNGPDVSFGWGLLNAKKMAETINNRSTTATISDLNLQNGSSYTLDVNSDGVSSLSASISWYDRAGTVQTSNQLNSSTKRLVNDLDIRVASSSGITYYPWALTSRSSNAKQDNTSDNFERIDAGVLPAGKYSITVTHKGTLTGGSQNYTLIVTGKQSGNTTPSQCSAPTNLTANNITVSGASLSWTSSPSTNNGYTVEYKTATAANWTPASTGTNTSYILASLIAGTEYLVRVKTNCSSVSSEYAALTFKTSSLPETSCTNAFENNNTIATAYTINSNEIYKAAIGTTEDVDYYKVTLPYGQYTASLTGLTHDVDLKIQNAAGSTLASSEQGGNANEQISATFNGGTYYFRIYPYSGSDANNCYQFSISNAAGNIAFATGVEPIDNGNLIKVYPNPARNEINFRLIIKGRSETAVRIYDMTGKEVLKNKGTDGDNKIDISKLVSGSYIITIGDGAEKTSTKFIKL